MTLNLALRNIRMIISTIVCEEKKMGWSKPIKDGTGKTIRRDSIEGPAGFNDSTAAVVVGNADFSDPEYVTQPTEKTKWAYTFVEYTDIDSQKWRLCVVGHAHMKNGKYVAPGNSFIPGWEAWTTPTPESDAKRIATFPNKGSFPDDARYPTKLG